VSRESRQSTKSRKRKFATVLAKNALHVPLIVSCGTRWCGTVVRQGPEGVALNDKPAQVFLGPPRWGSWFLLFRYPGLRERSLSLMFAPPWADIGPPLSGLLRLALAKDARHLDGRLTHYITPLATINRRRRHRFYAVRRRLAPIWLVCDTRWNYFGIWRARSERISPSCLLTVPCVRTRHVGTTLGVLQSIVTPLHAWWKDERNFSSAMASVDVEVAVDRENVTVVNILRHTHQAGVRQRHRDVAVTIHQ